MLASPRAHRVRKLRLAFGRLEVKVLRVYTGLWEVTRKVARFSCLNGLPRPHAQKARLHF